MSAPTILDLARIEAESGVAADTGDAFVLIRARSQGEAVVLVGQLTPPVASELAVQILEAGVAADLDAALFDLMLHRMGGGPEAEGQAAAILRDLRTHRDQRADGS